MHFDIRMPGNEMYGVEESSRGGSGIGGAGVYVTSAVQADEFDSICWRELAAETRNRYVELLARASSWGSMQHGTRMMRTTNLWRWVWSELGQKRRKGGDMYIYYLLLILVGKESNSRQQQQQQILQTAVRVEYYYEYFGSYRCSR